MPGDAFQYRRSSEQDCGTLRSHAFHWEPLGRSWFLVLQYPDLSQSSKPYPTISVLSHCTAFESIWEGSGFWFGECVYLDWNIFSSPMWIQARRGEKKGVNNLELRGKYGPGYALCISNVRWNCWALPAALKSPLQIRPRKLQVFLCNSHLSR